MSQYSKSSAGVVWFSQALRNFITPYGLAKAAPQPTEMIARLKPFTSEWLVRPNIAISEYAETISANLPFLRENAEDTLKSEYIEMLENHFAPMTNSLDALNKKTPSTPTTTDAKDIVKSLVTENNLDSAMEDLFKVSATVFAISGNYIMATRVLCHPKQFAHAIDGTKGKVSEEFKRTGSASAMKDYLLHSYKEGDGASTSGILSRKAPESVAKAFLDSDCFSSSDDHHLQQLLKRNAERHHKHHLHNLNDLLRRKARKRKQNYRKNELRHLLKNKIKKELRHTV